MSLYLGVDYGGTQTKLLLTREEDGVHRRMRQAMVPTPRGDLALDVLGMRTAEFLGAERPRAFGLTVAGVIDDAAGVVRRSTNMSWLEGRKPADELARTLGFPGRAVHDGAAAAAAEALLGAGRGHDDVFVLALGTGIAGAHVIDGKVRRGVHGAAGEVGHLSTGVGRSCSCGQRGCLESEIGGTRLGSRWDAERGVEQRSTAKDVVTASAAGDPLAIRLVDKATSALARTLLAIVAVVDPGAIVIGGGLSNSREWIVQPAIDKAHAAATFHLLPPIVTAELGSWAGAWGASLAAGSD